MMEHTLDLGLSDDIVQDHIISKLMEPILAIKPCAIDVIEIGDVICNFMVLVCIYSNYQDLKNYLNPIPK